MGKGHDHNIDGGQIRSRALWIALVANAGFVVAEIVGGIVFNSLALLADAAHMSSDVAGLGIALVAERLMRRPASARHTFGMQRAEVLGAQANAITLVLVAGWIFFEAVKRIPDPEPVEGGGLLVVAILGLAVNLGSAVILYRAKGQSLNMRGAVVHMLADAAGSVGVIVAGVAVLLWDAAWVDPVVSIAIGVLVLWSAAKLLRETTHILMEGVPRGLQPATVEAALEREAAVQGVHYLRLWNLASDVPALSAHVTLSGELSLHDAQNEGNRLKAMLRARFGIRYATLELECHPCAEDEVGRSEGPGGESGEI